MISNGYCNLSYPRTDIIESESRGNATTIDSIVTSIAIAFAVQAPRMSFPTYILRTSDVPYSTAAALIANIRMIPSTQPPSRHPSCQPFAAATAASQVHCSWTCFCCLCMCRRLLLWANKCISLSATTTCLTGVCSHRSAICQSCGGAARYFVVGDQKRARSTTTNYFAEDVSTPPFRTITCTATYLLVVENWGVKDFFYDDDENQNTKRSHSRSSAVAPIRRRLHLSSVLVFSYIHPAVLTRFQHEKVRH